MTFHFTRGCGCHYPAPGARRGHRLPLLRAGPRLHGLGAGGAGDGGETLDPRRRDSPAERFQVERDWSISEERSSVFLQSIKLSDGGWREENNSWLK